MTVKDHAQLGKDVIVSSTCYGEKDGTFAGASVDIWLQGNGINGNICLQPDDADRMADELRSFANVARSKSTQEWRDTVKAASAKHKPQ